MRIETVSGYEIPTKPILSARSQSLQQSNSMKLWHWITLAAIVALSTFLNFFQLQAGGPRGPFYAVAVHSMLLNWKNFFFLSYDPEGFVTVDKPPLDLWLQVASAKLFGFSTWSLSFPQALAGVLAVIVLFLVVHRLCGPEAGLLAALVMTTMPVGVWLSRINYLDMMVVLILLLATWALYRAIETGKLRWLLLAAALVGLGFNTKMAQAYLVLPAFGLFYLLSSRRSLRVRLVNLALALAVLLIVSLPWIVAVDLTPADQRPYVSNSQTNSELQLVLGYNGLSHLSPLEYQPQIANPQNQVQYLVQTGLFRLFNKGLGRYIAWLLPLAMIGLLALSWRKRIRLPLDPWQQAAMFWGVWLVTIYAFFSVTADVEDRYTVMLAPAIAALTGCGLLSMWQDYRERPLSNWRGWALPVVLGLTALVQVYLLSLYPDWRDWQGWLSPLVLGLSLIAALFLVLLRLLQRWSQRTQTQQRYSLEFIDGSLTRLQAGILQVRIGQCFVLITAIVALLLTPLIWSSTVTLSMSKNGGSFPDGPIPFNLLFAKPDSQGIWKLRPNQRKLVSYLQTHPGHTRFLVAMINVYPSWWSSSVMMATGESVMVLGGFYGTDPILTVERLKHLIADGTIRFFWLPAIYKFHMNKSGTFSRSHTLVPNGPRALKKFGQNEALIRWVNTHCRPVRAAKRDSTPLASYNSTEGVSDQLFDCSHTRLT